MSWRTTLFLVAPVWCGLIACTAAGAPLAGLLVALGAYIVLFGGGQPVWPRLRAYAIASVGLLVTVALGMVVAHSPLLTWASYSPRPSWPSRAPAGSTPARPAPTSSS